MATGSIRIILTNRSFGYNYVYSRILGGHGMGGAETRWGKSFGGLATCVVAPVALAAAGIRSAYTGEAFADSLDRVDSGMSLSASVGAAERFGDRHADSLTAAAAETWNVAKEVGSAVITAAKLTVPSDRYTGL
jgi:hypothetical protein